jgi:tetratricopeptide (TPR) repeat protein
LTAYSNHVDPEQLKQASARLANYDFDGAERILTQIVNDQELNVRQSAAAHYGLGEIAEERVNWQDALDHYERAYGQDPTFDHLGAYVRLCWQMGRWRDAVPLQQNILKQVAQDSGEQGAEYAEALNNLALVLQNLGEYKQAEPLYKQALEISRRVLGDDHPDTAASLNNLAEFYKAQGQFAQAEPLYVEAVEIAERVLGASIRTPRCSVKIMRVCWHRLRSKGVFRITFSPVHRPRAWSKPVHS